VRTHQFSAPGVIFNPRQVAEQRREKLRRPSKPSCLLPSSAAHFPFCSSGRFLLLPTQGPLPTPSTLPNSRAGSTVPPGAHQNINQQPSQPICLCPLNIPPSPPSILFGRIASQRITTHSSNSFYGHSSSNAARNQ
jgi:hypothetical protein